MDRTEWLSKAELGGRDPESPAASDSGRGDLDPEGELLLASWSGSFKEALYLSSAALF